MKKRKWRFIRCIWNDGVDTMMWLSVISFFLYSQLTGTYVSGLLWVVIGFVYYLMLRKTTFWQQKQKFYKYLKDRGVNPKKDILDKIDDF